jgi:translation initiation factor 1
MRLFEGTPFDIPPRCERCGKLEQECSCPPLPALTVPSGKQTARVAVENRKRGKVVTVIRGLIENDELLAALKTACGAGGTLKNGLLQIQGEHREKVVEILRQAGYRVIE